MTFHDLCDDPRPWWPWVVTLWWPRRSWWRSCDDPSYDLWVSCDDPSWRHWRPLMTLIISRYSMCWRQVCSGGDKDDQWPQVMMWRMSSDDQSDYPWWHFDHPRDDQNTIQMTLTTSGDFLGRSLWWTGDDPDNYMTTSEDIWRLEVAIFIARVNICLSCWLLERWHIWTMDETKGRDQNVHLGHLFLPTILPAHYFCVVWYASWDLLIGTMVAQDEGIRIPP